jgi:hypothetical protein
MIIQPGPVILPASPFHQFMARGKIGKYSSESKVHHLNISEMKSFCRCYSVFPPGFPQKAIKHSVKRRSRS